jgi:DNA-binding CsgD family transcriptional regulator
MLFTDWELDHLPFHAEYINRFDYRWFADMVIAGEGPSTIVLSAQRQVGTDRFSTSEIEILRRLVPHVRRAGDLALRFGTARHDGTLEALEQFDCGALLLDSSGRVIGSNAAAETLLEPGLMLRSGILTAADKTCDIALQRLIGSVVAQSSTLGSDPPDPVVVGRASGHARIVSASPLARTARGLFNGAVAVLMVFDPAARSCGHGRLLPRAFGFTDQEASIGAALCSGCDVDDLARTHGTDVSIVSLHIKSMLKKTGTRDQDELMSVIAHYVAASK